MTEGIPTWSFIATARIGDDAVATSVWCSPAGYAHPEVRVMCESSALDQLRKDHPDATDLETQWVFSVIPGVDDD